MEDSELEADDRGGGWVKGSLMVSPVGTHPFWKTIYLRMTKFLLTKPLFLPNSWLATEIDLPARCRHLLFFRTGEMLSRDEQQVSKEADPQSNTQDCHSYLSLLVLFLAIRSSCIFFFFYHIHTYLIHYDITLYKPNISNYIWKCVYYIYVSNYDYIYVKCMYVFIYMNT